MGSRNRDWVLRSLGWAPLLVFLALWELSVHGSQTATFLFASPSSVAKAFLDGFRSGILARDTVVTAAETILGFLLGNLVGSLIGLSLWYSKMVATISRRYIVAIGAVPIFALAPMMIIWFGTGLLAKVMMSAISTFVVATAQAYEGARNVDEDQLKLFRSFGASKRVTFAKVVVPASLIWVLASYRLNIGFALLGSFIGEFVSSSDGLGHRILKAGGLYDVPTVLAAVLCMIGLALGLNWLVGRVEKKLLAWRHV